MSLLLCQNNPARGEQGSPEDGQGSPTYPLYRDREAEEEREAEGGLGPWEAPAETSGECRAAEGLCSPADGSPPVPSHGFTPHGALWQDQGSSSGSPAEAESQRSSGHRQSLGCLAGTIRQQ